MIAKKKNALTTYTLPAGWPGLLRVFGCLEPLVQTDRQVIAGPSRFRLLSTFLKNKKTNINKQTQPKKSPTKNQHKHKTKPAGIKSTDNQSKRIQFQKPTNQPIKNNRIKSRVPVPGDDVNG